MANISLVVTQDDGEKRIFELTQIQSNILRDNLCMGTNAANDVVLFAGSRTWALEREGLSDAELQVFREMFETLRNNFTRRF